MVLVEKDINLSKYLILHYAPMLLLFSITILIVACFGEKLDYYMLGYRKDKLVSSSLLFLLPYFALIYSIIYSCIIKSYLNQKIISKKQIKTFMIKAVILIPIGYLGSIIYSVIILLSINGLDFLSSNSVLLKLVSCFLYTPIYIAVSIRAVTNKFPEKICNSYKNINFIGYLILVTIPLFAFVTLPEFRSLTNDFFEETLYLIFILISPLPHLLATYYLLKRNNLISKP